MDLRRFLTFTVFAMTIMIVAGCSGGTQAPSSQSEPAESEQDAVAEEIAPPAEATLAERQAALDEREKELAEREAALAKPRSSGTTPAKAPAPTAPPASRASNTVESPARTPTPAVERIAMTVPSGTMFDIEILDAVSSETSLAGDRFRARLVGAAVGTAIAAKNQGDPVMLDASTVIGLTLDEPVNLVLENGRPAFETVANR